jgi:cytochrome c oxidase assembly protein subunit 15
MTTLDTAATTPSMSQVEDRDRWQIAIWLLVCCALIFSMVVLGGVTRLTGSGLSIVEWKPVSGILPPLDHAAWEEEFSRYRESPEYSKINPGMDLEAFQRIYWFEFAHRLLGRTIGVAFLLPFLYFLVRGRIEKTLAPRLALIFVLGGLQGALGWYMVKSGLVDNPHVSQYRLTAHLLAAIIIYGYILWVALGLLSTRRTPKRSAAGSSLGVGTAFVTALILITIISGGFVAGLKAGLAYNTFPLMGGQWIPGGILALDPWYRNLFDNIATVQFDHRLLALLVLVSVVSLWRFSRRFELAPAARTGYLLLLGMAFLQVALGISTLLLHVPVALAAAHQAGALILFSIALYVNHRLRTAARPA